MYRILETVQRLHRKTEGYNRRWTIGIISTPFIHEEVETLKRAVSLVQNALCHLTISNCSKVSQTNNWKIVRGFHRHRDKTACESLQIETICSKVSLYHPQSKNTARHKGKKRIGALPFALLAFRPLSPVLWPLSVFLPFTAASVASDLNEFA